MAKQKQKSKPSPVKTPPLTRQEQSAQKRKAAKVRQEFTELLTKTLGISLALGAPIFFVGGIKAAVPAVLGILVIAFSYKYPREALFAFLIYMPFGGTIVYYLGNSPVLQLAKDAFYFPAMIALWQTCRQMGRPFIIPQSIKIPLSIVFVSCLMTLVFINGGQQLSHEGGGIPIGMGILGLKVFLGYVPLISCVYYLIRNKQDFLLVSRLQVILTFVCCALGVVQYLLLDLGICNGTRGLSGNELFVTSLDARCYFGGALLFSPDEGVIRLPGTFVAPWQWAWFLIASTFLNFATAFSDPNIIWRLISLVSLASVFINAVISGQRIALALVPVCFVLLLLLTGQLGDLKRFIPLGFGLALILGIGIISNPEIVAERTASFTDRWAASPPQEFIVGQFEENWHSVKSPIGSGLGRATNSARAMGETKLVETYYPKVLYEVGIVGVLAFLALVTSLTIAGFKTYRSIKNRNFRTYGASIWVFILFISYNTYYYPLDVDPVAVYYWFFAGVLFKLPVIDKQERETVDAQVEIDSKKPKKKLS